MEHARYEDTTDRQMAVLRSLAIVALVGVHTTWFHLLSASLDGAAGRAVALVHLLAGVGIPLLFVLVSLELLRQDGAPFHWRRYLGQFTRRALRFAPGYLFWSLLTAATLEPEWFDSPRELFWMLAGGNADEQFHLAPPLFAFCLAWPLVRPLAAWGTTRGPGAWVLRSVVPRPAIVAGAVAVTVPAAWFLYRNFISLVEPSYLPEDVWSAGRILQVPKVLYALSAIPAALGVTALVSNRRWAGKLGALGEHGYGIYLVHLLVLRLVVHPLLPPISVHDASLPTAMGIVAVSWAGCLFASFVLVAVLARSRFTRPFVTHRW